MNKKRAKFDQLWIRVFTAAFLLIFTLVAGCSGQAILDTVFPSGSTSEGTEMQAENTAELTDGASTDETETPAISVTEQPTAEVGDFTIAQSEILVWVPEEFTTLEESEASLLLQQQIDDFERENPGVVVNVRVKSSSGTSGILNSLKNTKTAAPSALPQVILLTQADMESAAEQQLILPVEEYSHEINPAIYYSYAHEISNSNGVIYGFPFVGDALVGIATGDIANVNFASWDDLRAERTLLYFAANYPQARLFISQYLSAGGSMVDEQGITTFSDEILLQVLEEFNLNVDSNIFSNSFNTLNTSDDVWAIMQAGETEWVINWASKALQSDSVGYQIFQIPSLGTEAYASATGWVWSVVNTESEIAEIVPMFIEYLSEPQFLAEYSQAIGYLPVMPDSLALYEDDGSLNQLSNILISAHTFPENDLILELGPIFRDATLMVLNQQNTLEEIVETARNQLEALQTK